MILLRLALFVLLFSSSAFATGQAPDKIFYNGEEKDLFSNPLEDYYKSDPQKRPAFLIQPLAVSSANWRGYVASWEIADGKLYLTKIDSWLCDNFTKESCKRADLARLFPDNISNGKVLAAWYAGQLLIPDGKRLQLVNTGYASTYERNIVFTVQSGIVSGPEIIDNTKRPLPSVVDAGRRELDRLKKSPLGDRPVFGNLPRKPATISSAGREPSKGIVIVPGQGLFKVGTTRSDLEAIIGDGEQGSRDEDVYFIEYPKAGVQVSYKNNADTVHVIFLYNGEPRYENFVAPAVKTDKGIDWNSSDREILKAYGKPLKDFSDDRKTWRRLEYPGIDFRFESGKLVRIGILGPDGN